MTKAFRPVFGETITSTATRNRSSVVLDDVVEVRLEPGGVCYVKVGTDPDATDGGMRISPSYPPEHIQVFPGEVVETYSPDHDTDVNVIQLTRLVPDPR